MLYSSPNSSVETWLGKSLNTVILNFQVGMQLAPVTNPFLSREFSTSIASRDIESAAKFIGAGAATVGAAGMIFVFLLFFKLC